MLTDPEDPAAALSTAGVAGARVDIAGYGFVDLGGACDAGAFAGAPGWGLARFSGFPAALAPYRAPNRVRYRGGDRVRYLVQYLVQYLAPLRGHTVVSCCTGGVRCKKAALRMQQAVGPDVWPLPGGILRCFPQVTRAPHRQGDCGVFDDHGSVSTGVATAA